MDDNDDQGLRLDTGKYVEEARGYPPDDSDDAGESLLEKIKEGFVGDEDQIEGDDEQRMT